MKRPTHDIRASILAWMRTAGDYTSTADIARAHDITPHVAALHLQALEGRRKVVCKRAGAILMWKPRPMVQP